MEQNEVLKALRRDHAAELKLAAERLKGTARHTEIIPSPVLSEMTGHEILLKPENLQVTGSFKIRGAYNKIASLSDEQLAHGIVTASAGNHAQGVAYAARERGAKATICMPQITPPLKVDATKAYGADVVLHGKKLCGILTESSLLPDGSAAWLVVGIGVNVGQASFPPDIADMATSLALQELDVSPDALADAILAQLTAMRTVLTDPVEWLAEYRRRCVNLGRPVRVLRGNTVRQATALAIDEQFGLTVQYENGETETVRSGEVSVRGLYGYIE